MYTHLLTSGCSFTETIHCINTPYDTDTVHEYFVPHLKEFLSHPEDYRKESFYCPSWVPFLANELNIPIKRVTNYGMGSQGNQMIARNIVHGLEALLASGVPVKDILVGVQWSGISRGCVYSSNIDLDYQTKNSQNWFANPVRFLTEPPEIEKSVGWKIFNHHWGSDTILDDGSIEPGHEDSKSYYKIFNETSTFAIESAERIHWVQEYLSSKGIDFFFTNMSQKASIFDSRVDNIPDMHVRKTIDLVDRSKFCEYLGIAEWQSEYFNDPDMMDLHPNTYSSYLYMKEQILPHLADRNFIQT